MATTVGVRILQVQTEAERTSKNSLTFTLNAKGNFELAGYCMSNVGCWKTAIAKSAGTNNRIEVAMVAGK